MAYIVDIQGFKRPLNAFTFKEVAVTPLEDDSVPSVYLFEPPYSWTSLPGKFRSENSWLTRNYHGIPWEAGDIPYADVQEVLRSALKDATRIYVKGLEKKQWLGMLVPHIYNLEDLGCPSLSRLANNKRPCTHPPCCSKSVCAAQNVDVLREWFLNRNSSFDEIDFE